MKKHLFTVLFLFIAYSVQAQIKADRPGIASTSYVVEQGKLLIESGFNYSQFNPDADGQIAIGELFLRTGIYDRLEVVAGLNSYVSSDAFDNGLENAVLGLRWNVINVPAFNLPPAGSSRTDPYQETKFSVSLAGNLFIPSGGAGTASDDTEGNIGIYADFEPENPDFTEWSISSNLVFFLDDLDGNDDMLFTITPSFTPTGNQNLSIYTGYAGYYGSVQERYFLELGVLNTVSNGRIQLDLNSGYDLNNDGFFIGAGIAFAVN